MGREEDYSTIEIILLWGVVVLLISLFISIPICAICCYRQQTHKKDIEKQRLLSFV